jgi:hypothetical protein
LTSLKNATSLSANSTTAKSPLLLANVF